MPQDVVSTELGDAIGAIGNLFDDLNSIVTGASRWFSVILGILALAGAVAAWRGWSPLGLHVLRHTRAVTVGRALIYQGIPPERVKGGIRQITTSRVQGGARWTVRAELRWLDGLVDPARTPITCFGLPAAPPTQNGQIDVSMSLLLLADAYAALASRLNSRLLISAGQVPVIHAEAKAADETSRALRNFAASRAAEPAGSCFRRVVNAPEMVVELLQAAATKEGGAAASPTGVTWHWPEKIIMSQRELRRVPPLEAAHLRAQAEGVPVHQLAASPDEVTLLETRISGRNFDGILPSLTGWRFERDPANGYGRLHLSVCECTYSAVLLTSYGGDAGVGREWDPGRSLGTAENANLLTLSMMLVTTDGWLVALRRPAHLPPMGGLWVPSVNGNLEIGLRSGITQDIDAFGLLDPVTAIVREAREELGLRIDRERVRCTGLARIATRREWGTYVLCFVGQADTTLDGVRQSIQLADPVEGAYEVGESFLQLPWRDSRSQAEDLASWAAHAPDASPHLVACLVALAAGYPPDRPRVELGAAYLASLPLGAVISSTSPHDVLDRPPSVGASEVSG